MRLGSKRLDLGGGGRVRVGSSGLDWAPLVRYVKLGWRNLFSTNYPRLDLVFAGLVPSGGQLP